MELPNIGKFCSSPQCKQLDFLPFQCKCGQIFCRDHFNSHLGSCEPSKQLTEAELKTIGNILICSHVNCNERSIVPLICDKCEKHFCIKHRHLVQCEETSPEALAREKERYSEPVRKFEAAKAVVDKNVETTLNAAAKKTKSKEMAHKLQLMKIKNKATGLKTIPITDRIYFNVTYNGTTVALFVSKTWSLGRVIDAFADGMKLQNNNNKSNEKKLRLFRQEDKESISKDLSATIEKLLKEKTVRDGENLLIEYVEDM